MNCRYVFVTQQISMKFSLPPEWPWNLCKARTRQTFHMILSFHSKWWTRTREPDEVPSQQLTPCIGEQDKVSREEKLTLESLQILNRKKRKEKERTKNRNVPLQREEMRK